MATERDRKRQDQLERSRRALFGTWPEITDFAAFYRHLFAPVSAAFGPFDQTALTPKVGFQHGGDVNLCTVGRTRKASYVTYVTCELACYRNQVPAAVGPFELLVTSNDQRWASAVLSALGRLSFDAELDQGHSVDVGRVAGPDVTLQGVVLERFSTSKIGQRHYSVLRVIGITRPEMEWCLRFSPGALIQRLKLAGLYPLSDSRRRSVSLKG
jgi:hypothetical protein